MAEKLSVLFDLDLLLIVLTFRRLFKVKCFGYLLKGKILLPFYGLAVEPLNRAAANF